MMGFLPEAAQSRGRAVAFLKEKTAAVPAHCG
jgi:hypothetical protein